MQTISPIINIMLKACEKASKVLKRDFGEIENLQVSIKGPNDFVTNADKKCEKIIIKELIKSKKDFSIISEETGIYKNKDKDNVWILDPIDGTSNFMHGVPHFAISLALKSKNEIIAGVIYDPIKDEIFYGEKNVGSFLNNHRIRVSKRKNLDHCLFASGNKKLDNFTDLNIRKSGSAALDIAYVACGRYEGYFQNNLSIWDIAAGIVILKEAGGVINEININDQNHLKIIATNPYINENLLKILSKF